MLRHRAKWVAQNALSSLKWRSDGRGEEEDGCYQSQKSRPRQDNYPRSFVATSQRDPCRGRNTPEPAVGQSSAALSPRDSVCRTSRTQGTGPVAHICRGAAHDDTHGTTYARGVAHG